MVNAFWSLHLGGVPDFLPVPNRRDRFMLSTYSNVQTNPDGSLTLVLGPKPAADFPEANWLPTPLGRHRPIANTGAIRGEYTDSRDYPGMNASQQSRRL